MAKRKRLSPAAMTGEQMPVDPETKALGGWSGARARAPIADVSGEAAASAAFEEVAGELQKARREGRMVLRLPLDAVQEDYLVRDRIAVTDDEMASLTDSLRARGQQTPVEVVDLGDGRYGLISGWRRMRALRALAEEGGAPGEVLVLLRTPVDATEAYRAMIEENEIRADLSFYERARIAVQAVRQGLYPDSKRAVQSLFSAARPPKRSKIIAFTRLVEAMDGDLRFPAAIPEKLGLALVQALQEDPRFAGRVRKALIKAVLKDAAAERKVLDRALRSAQPAKSSGEVRTLAPDLHLKITAGGVTLSGSRVDAGLIEDLSVWLATRS
jgi:ParB/RepB/Spo0J family partition protein